MERVVADLNGLLLQAHISCLGVHLLKEPYFNASGSKYLA